MSGLIHPEFRKGWKPLTAALIGTAFGGAPVTFNVLPLVIGPMHEEFGWSFQTISAGITVYGVIGALLAPFYGALIDKIGVRSVAIWSLLGLSLAFASFGLLTSSIVLYFSLCVLLGLIVIGSTPITWSRNVNMWFDERRGFALGIMLMGTSLAGFIVPQIAGAIIQTSGWRYAFPALALLPLLVALPIVLAWFREPSRSSEQKHSQRVEHGVSLSEALKDHRFWLLAISILLIALAYGGLYIHIGQMVAGHGFGPSIAATAISMMALGILLGRLLFGYLFDHFWAPVVVFPALLCGAIACILLMGQGQPLYLLLLAGFLLGVSSGGESDAIAFMTVSYFGIRAYGKIYGALYMTFALGAAISPLCFGIARDRLGGYDEILSLAAVLFVFGGVLMLFLGRYRTIGAVQ